MSDQERFKAFTKELAQLSLKYGITIKSIGGVEIYNKYDGELTSATYSEDYTSGDLIPYVK